LFKKYRKSPNDPDLAENEAHLFLEKCDEPVTVHKLREFLKEIDLDNNRKLCFLEYAHYKWQKSVKDFFYNLANPPKGGSAALDAAVKAHREVLQKRADREAKMDKLRDDAKQSGVKGKTAQSHLHQMESEDQLAMNKHEITVGAAKRKAEKEAKDDPFELEQKRVAEAKKKRR